MTGTLSESGLTHMSRHVSGGGDAVMCVSAAGIGIKTYANPEVERNRIHHGGAMGVMCSENGGGTLRDNEFFANR